MSGQTNKVREDMNWEATASSMELQSCHTCFYSHRNYVEIVECIQSWVVEPTRDTEEKESVTQVLEDKWADCSRKQLKQSIIDT